MTRAADRDANGNLIPLQQLPLGFVLEWCPVSRARVDLTCGYTIRNERIVAVGRGWCLLLHAHDRDPCRMHRK